MTETPVVRNNAEASRYELEVEGSVCFAAYERRDGAVVFTHTEVPQSLGGRGLGSTLVKGALDDVRSQNLKVIAVCEFVAAYIDRHPEEQDLLATGAPG